MKARVKGELLELDASNGSLGEALRAEGLMIDMRCGGNGSCGKCEVILLRGRFSLEGEVFEVQEPRAALACRCFALDDEAEIEIPDESLAKENPECLELFNRALSTTPEEGGDGLALAVDVGTTTVAAALLDLRDGATLATASQYNNQLRYGDNVIARIACAFQSEENAAALQKAIVEETVNPLLDELLKKAGASRSALKRACFSGNTTMTHLLFKLPVDGMGQTPFTPFTLVYPETTAKELGLALNAGTEVLAAPAASAFVGGDALSGALLCGLAGAKGAALLVDLGTNCETALFRDGTLTACASAAGPAFEGAGVECGRRAAPGAIDRLKIEDGLVFKLSTIAGEKPDGLCGSAMLDFLAEGRRAGILNEFGRLDMELLRRHGRAAKGYGGIAACRIDDAGDVFLSERDIEQLLKAKAAIAAGVKTLCEKLDCPVEELERIHLAGGFAQYLNLENAIACGMLPKLPLERYAKAGNSSLAGAVRLALRPSSMKNFLKISRETKTVVLNELPTFEDNYIDALLLP